MRDLAVESMPGKVKSGKNKITQEWIQWLHQDTMPSAPMPKVPMKPGAASSSEMPKMPEKPSKSAEILAEKEAAEKEAAKKEAAKKEAAKKEAAKKEAAKKEAAEKEAAKKEAAEKEAAKKEILMETQRILQYDVTRYLNEFFILNLPATCELNDVRVVFRKFSLLLHPDKSSNIISEPQQQERVRQAFVAVKAAADKAKTTVQVHRPPPPPQPSQPRPRGAQMGKRCAHPHCDFQVTHITFGGFCCKWCHLTSVLGDPIRHGRKCHGKLSQNLERAEPVEPDVPMKSERVGEC